MKKPMQLVMMIVCSLFASNLEAAADQKRMISIISMGEGAPALHLSIPCNGATTIKEIKEYIYTAKRIPIGKQELYKVEQVKSPFLVVAPMKKIALLEDDGTCDSYDIESGTVLCLSLMQSISPLTLNQ